MLETIRNWLNGNREYYNGVAIYSQAGTNENLLKVLKQGPNDFRVKRLQEELLALCNELKKKNPTNVHKTANHTGTLSKAIKTNTNQFQVSARPHKIKNSPIKLKVPGKEKLNKLNKKNAIVNKGMTNTSPL